MPILIAILGIIGAIIFWSMRARNAAETGRELMDVANDVRLAARRFGFKRNANRHPVEDIDDAKVAIGGLAVSFLELDDYPTQEQRHALLRGLQDSLKINLDDAEELSVLGRWLMSECGSPDAAVTRLARKLSKLGGAEQITPLMEVLQTVLGASEGDMNAKQRSALDDVKRAFKI
jgi:hypothetical protein